ncbi:hypothetical protein RHGRI_036616 [Rhododendron griersonianum]|uniref:Core Histone H2A/H2B/H3 domain-containing protein n=1 Tax=Rhododendron griersonianum TaxID=479676 RepID=A0AAV6HNJ4_9ERIC|nr:hypothetical protein RHGRI_036616 [Rhododendron griersonianum]
MGPKKKQQGNVVGTVVRTTRRVVQQTVQVAVVEGNQTLLDQCEEQEQEEPHEREEVVVQEQEQGDEDEETQEEEEEEEQGEIVEETEDQRVPPSKKEDGQKYKTHGGDTEKKTTTQPAQEIEKMKATQEAGKESEKKRRGRRTGRRRTASDTGEVYKRYVYRVLKQVHPELGVSSKAMTVLNNFMSDMFERLADEAARLLKYTGRKTLTSSEIQAAVKLVLPGELGKHAVVEGTKAVKAYLASTAAAGGGAVFEIAVVVEPCV